MQALDIKQKSIPFIKNQTEFNSSQQKAHSQSSPSLKILLAMPSQQSPLKENFTTTIGCGNKHARLMQQIELVKSQRLDNVVIPQPHSINTGQIITLLQHTNPRVFELWQNIVDHFNQEHSTSFLTNPDAFFNQPQIQQALDEIDAAITISFKNVATLSDVLSLHFIDPSLLEWLQLMQSKKSFLMVRSDGAEDGLQGANAGGNKSVAYVPPTWQPFIQAVGIVVSSYFTPLSLKNRLCSGQNPFTNTLQLSVTVQELIGEPVDEALNLEEIPRSLVLFTHDVMLVEGESYRLMRMSATFGHGDAVVGDHDIATDTIWLLWNLGQNELSFIYDNREKKYRLAPVKHPTSGEISLCKVANPPSLVSRRVFDDAMLERLFSWGLLVENFFGDKATDMEIVVKGNVIYPVQARPLVRQPATPTYVDLKSIAPLDPSPLQDSIEAWVLVPGKGNVIQVNQAEEILQAHSLGEVQEKRLFKPGCHKVVLVEHEDTCNSHAVVNFCGYGIPCLVVGDKCDKVKTLLSSIESHHTVAICTQSGTIYLWDNRRASLTKHCPKGFTSHPANVAISVNETRPLAAVNTSLIPPKEVRELLRHVSTAKTSTLALQHLAAVKEHPWLKAFFSKTIDLEQELIIEHSLAKKALSPLQNCASELSEIICRTFKQLEDILQANTETLRSSMLIFVKVLDTLLFSTTKRPGAIGHYSVVNICRNFAAADIQKDYLKELTHSSHFLGELMYGKLSVAPEVFDKWRTFLLSLDRAAERGEIDKSSIKRLKSLLHTLERFDALPHFLLFDFGKLYSHDGLQTAERILQLMPAKEEALILALIERRDSFQDISKRMSDFAMPDKFNALAFKLRQELRHFQSWPQEFIDRTNGEFKKKFPLAQILTLKGWNESSALLKGLVIATLNALIHLYDSAIKSMKSSRDMSLSEKLSHFELLLEPFIKQASQLADNLVGFDAFPAHPNWPLKGYFDKIWSKFMDLCDSNKTHPWAGQLLPSHDFSVSAALIGSETDFARHLPKTLEDLFTLTHQNLCALAAKLNDTILASCNLNEVLLPKQLQQAMHSIDEIYKLSPGGVIATPQRLSVEVSAERISICYNQPLRNHSGRFTLIQCANQESHIQIDAQFLGLARERWAEGAHMVAIFSRAYGCELPLCSVKPQELSFQLRFAPEDIMAVLKLYREIAMLSLDDAHPRDHFVALFTCPEQLVKISDYLVESNKRFNKTALSFCRQLIQNGISLTYALILAKRGIVDLDSNNRILALSCFSKLFERGEGFDVAEKVAAQIIVHQDYQIAEFGLKLLEELFKWNRGEEKAAEMMLQHFGFNAVVNNLTARLIERGRYLKDIAVAITREFEGVSSSTKHCFLFFLMKIVQAGEGYAIALELSEREISSQDQIVVKGVVQLILSLLQQPQGRAAIIKIALLALESKNTGLLENLISPLDQLLSYSEWEPVVAKIAETWLFFEKNAAVETLYRTLCQKGLGFDSLETCLKEALESIDIWEIGLSYTWIARLCIKFQKALPLVEEYSFALLKQSNKCIALWGKKFLKSLQKKGYVLRPEIQTTLKSFG